MAISDWPASEQPREKLIEHGPGVLSDAELLAIFLRVGVKGKNAVALARELLDTFGSLNGIFSASLEQVSSVSGMGESKYCQLQAIFEMSRRALNEELKTGNLLDSPDKVRDYLALTLMPLKQEVFMVLFLDAQNRVITHEQLFKGTLSEAAVYPREVVKKVIAHHAAAVILAHNHPSGVPEPSQADLALTQKLKEAVALIDVRILDHLIVAGNQMYSFAESGLL